MLNINKTRLQDLPAGHDGSAYFTLNDTMLAAFKVAKISGKIEPIVENKQMLGQIVEQNAQRGIKISGDLSYYNTTPALLKAYRDFKNGGAIPDIYIQYFSDAGTYERVEVTLSGVILASILMGTLDDSSSDAQKLDSSFTANDFDII